jgi:ERF superfamily protein
MSKSDSIVNLSKALFKFQSEVANISKDSENPFFKSRYASLHHILQKIDPVLSDAGLVLLQHPISVSPDIVTLKTTLLHSQTGEYMESEYSMVPVKKDPQAFGSCITYMRRYALVSILKLNIDDNDDDGNEASNPKQKKESKFKELKDKLELCQSKEELAKMVSEIQSSQLINAEKSTLRSIYKVRLDAFDGAIEIE